MDARFLEKELYFGIYKEQSQEGELDCLLGSRRDEPASSCGGKTHLDSHPKSVERQAKLKEDEDAAGLKTKNTERNISSREVPGNLSQPATIRL